MRKRKGSTDQLDTDETESNSRCLSADSTPIRRSKRHKTDIFEQDNEIAASSLADATQFATSHVDTNDAELGTTHQALDFAAASAPKRHKAAVIGQNDDRFRNIEGAPPFDTDLPYECMQRITSEELITFYPNHVLRWPAIAARVSEDGFTPQRVVEKINRERMTLDNSGHEIDAANLIFVQWALEHLNRDFHEDTHWTVMSRRKVAIDKYATRPWVPEGKYRSYRTLEIDLKPAWPLTRVGAYFGENPYDVPGTGLFRDQVAAAIGRATSVMDASGTERRRLSNPPQLPTGWSSAVQHDRSIQWRNIDHGNRNSTSFFNTRETMANFNSQKLTREVLDLTIRDDAETIIDEHPDLLAGEILLWIISRNGGRMLLIDVYEKVLSNVEEFNAKLPESSHDIKHRPSRSTFNVRKRQALQQRAAYKDTSYEDEFRFFDAHEAFDRARRDPVSPGERLRGREKGKRAIGKKGHSGRPGGGGNSRNRRTTSENLKNSAQLNGPTAHQDPIGATESETYQVAAPVYQAIDPRLQEPAVHPVNQSATANRNVVSELDSNAYTTVEPGLPSVQEPEQQIDEGRFTEMLLQELAEQSLSSNVARR